MYGNPAVQPVAAGIASCVFQQVAGKKMAAPGTSLDELEYKDFRFGDSSTAMKGM